MNKFFQDIRQSVEKLNDQLKNKTNRSAVEGATTSSGQKLGGGEPIQATAVAAGGGTSALTTSANAELRRKAVMEAAEARERAYQQRMKPIEKGSKKSSIIRTTDNNNIQEKSTTNAIISSDETKRAIEAAKAGEVKTIAQLGYNPYEVTKGTGNQAQMAIIASNTATSVTTTADNGAAGNNSQPTQVILTPLNEPFDTAFLTLITSNQNEEEIISSLNVIHKLILNATTKGLEEEDDKYRRVRLSNPKITSAIVTMHGGLDLMFSCGFELVEGKDETFLVYPMDKKTPDWIPMALQHMNNYVERWK